MRASHKVPTHMHIPDKVVFGLTARQLLILLIGCSAGYDLWLQLHMLNPYHAVSLLARVSIALLPVAVALILALISVAGRPLEVWFLVLLRYRQRPRLYVWRSVRTRQPEEPTAMRAVAGDQADLESEQAFGKAFI